MRVLIVTPGVEPLIPLDERGEAVGGLAKALAAAGASVTVVAPFRARETRQQHNLARRLRGIEVDCGGQLERVALLDGRLGTSAARALLLAHPSFEDMDVSAPGAVDEQPYALFARAVLQAALELPLDADVLHAHDWACGMVPLFAHRSRAASNVRDLPIAFTVYADGGQLAPPRPSAFAWLGSSDREVIALADGTPSLLKAGLRYSDAILFSSVATAEDVATGRLETDSALEALYSDRRGAIGGVTPGLDYELWNPATSGHLAASYSAEHLGNRSVCKAALLDQLKLVARPSTPLITCVAPSPSAGGPESLLDALETLPWPDVQVAVFGPLNADSSARLAALQSHLHERHPPALAWSPEPVSEGQLERILAGSDALWLAPRQGDAGLLALKAMRFGAVPIVSPVGSLRDVVVDFDRESGTGTGLWLDSRTTDGSARALQRLVELYGAAMDWERLVRNALSQRATTETCAARYMTIYRRLLAEVPPELTV